MKNQLKPLAVALFLALGSSAANAGAIHDAAMFTGSTLSANDDGSTGAVNIGFNINFFGNNYSSLYINNNGNTTFSGPLSTFTPSGITGASLAMLAPFFADVDTRGAGSGLVQYGTGSIGGHSVFGVNWINVGYFSQQTDKLNSFQLVVTDRSDTGAGNFDFEFNYDTINWETGSASGGINGFGGTSAAAGWTNGTGTYFQFDGSLVNGALLDSGPNALVDGSRNSQIAGQYIFSVRNGQVINNNVPEPTTMALLGLGLVGLAARRRKASAK